MLTLQMIPLVTICGLPGDTNQIERASSLGAGRVWVPLATVVLTNAVQEWYDRISPPGSQGFYRSVLVGAGSRPTPGLRFVWLPAGQFVMGSPTNEVDRSDNEGPQTRVTLTRGFFLGRYEVTQKGARPGRGAWLARRASGAGKPAPPPRHAASATRLGQAPLGAAWLGACSATVSGLWEPESPSCRS